MRWGALHGAGTERNVDIFIGHERDLLAIGWVDDHLADEVSVLLVFRVDEDGGVAEHRLRSCGRDDKGFIGSHHIVFEIIELAFVVLVDDFDVA